jgi:superfamily II DNA/RNA helicase
MNILPRDVPSSKKTREEFIQSVDDATIVRMVTSDVSVDAAIPAAEKLPRLAYLFESQGVRAYRRSLKEQMQKKEDLLQEMRSSFHSAFACWVALFSLVSHTQSSVNGISAEHIRETIPAFHNEKVSPDLFLALRIGLNGLLAERTTEVRFILKRFDLSSIHAQTSWREIVIDRILLTFIRLIRKADGWRDIYTALEDINQLKQFQKQYEASYLEQSHVEDREMDATIELVGLYHLAQLVTISGEYVRTGQETLRKVSHKMDHHHTQALLAFEDIHDTVLVHMADLLWLGNKRLAQNAIWSHVVDPGPATQTFINALTNTQRTDPIIELWPSQQIALKQLLNIYPNAISVQIPTSGGKTLLAKFAIMQAYALRPDGLITYIVPTRALVNQITRELRKDFWNILRVEQTIPAFELDPTEERLLDSPTHILVTTPEKLDLLIRRNHPVTRNISMVVVDEAHTIGDENRGARLELLLGTIKRDRRGVRFLLLSPFLPNGEELASWLGDERTIPPISVDWKPNRKLVGTVRSVFRQRQWFLELETQESALVKDIKPGLRMVIGRGSNDKTIKNITRLSVQSLVERGTVLVLCYGKKTAVTRAAELAQDRETLPFSEEVEAVCRYLEAEAGYPLSLTTCLRKGVAYHHAGLSQEARWLIESLISHGYIKVVCGTTTLAQGVNFPIATIILERLTKGDSPLSYQDFWNIAGRAGRTHVDPLGIVAFPAPDEEKLHDFQMFLQGHAKDVSSQLTSLITGFDEIGNRFGIEMLRKFNQLSSLLQFLAHALRVAKEENIAEEVEELLRASLVFHQVQNENTQAAHHLVELCKSYLEKIQKQKGLVEIADKTGFATPSVSSLIQQRSKNQELVIPENWEPGQFFEEHATFLKMGLDALSRIPEMDLNEAVFPGSTQKNIQLRILQAFYMAGSKVKVLRR